MMVMIIHNENKTAAYDAGVEPIFSDERWISSPRHGPKGKKKLEGRGRHIGVLAQDTFTENSMHIRSSHSQEPFEVKSSMAQR
jgi:hypothetical protein